MFVIPKEGLQIVDPALKDKIPPEGRDVGEDYNNYWLRHFQDGSVKIVAEDKVDAAKANAEKVQAQRQKEAAEKAAADQAAAEKAEADKAPKTAEPKNQK